MEQSTLISGLALRSFDQRYHSLAEALKRSGKRAVAATEWSSTLRKAGVGFQVLLTYSPDPRKVLWYQSQFCLTSLLFKAKAAKWQPIQAPPFSMYCWKASRCAFSSGRLSRKITAWYWASLAALQSFQSWLTSYWNP